ncbi:MAG TPA: hypothetical protein VMN36_10840 [Verrucomicrobiales bacterium]|nr:hypothetical protein [Verrucomicrobiales bacterium]
MSKLQTPKHKGTRDFFRVAGLLVAGAGLVFLIIGLASFFSAFGAGGPPRLFWCCFVGMPLLFVGSVMCLFGFMGAVSLEVGIGEAAELLPKKAVVDRWLRAPS